MRIARGLAASAVVLLLGGGVGAIGSWAVSAGAILLLLGGVAGAIAKEEHDYVEGLLPVDRRIQAAWHDASREDGGEHRLAPDRSI
jgi:hypothetical protein